MATTKQLSDGGPDGTTLGQSSTDIIYIDGVVSMRGSSIQVGNAAADLVAFHGSTPTDQYATIAALTTGSTVATVETAVQDIIALLKEKGLCGT